MSDAQTLKVALYSGIVVERDAVSWSLLHKLHALRRLIALGAPIEVSAFAQSIDDFGPELVCCPTVAKLIGHRAFWDADIHIFEEGMYYDLFDSIYLIPSDRPILAVEHNSTPAELVDVPQARLAVKRSHAQRRNLLAATHVACVSELNVEMARSVGVPDDKISVLHLPPAITPIRPVEPLERHDGPVRLLYLGRFVRAKGILDMLELTTPLVSTGDGAFHVTLAGDPRFSDPDLMALMEETAKAAPEAIEIIWSPDDDVMAGLFERSDALVVPSYHEGYCVPVVEAYGFGRFVIAYDAGNLPNVVGDLGLTVPTGDVSALEAAVRSFASGLRRTDEPVLPVGEPAGQRPGEWRNAVRRHLRDYSAANFERRLLGLLCDLTATVPGGILSLIEPAIAARLDELGDTD